MHILHNRHQFAPADETLKLLKPCNKGTKMNCWEALYMNMHYKQGLLIPEQQVIGTNPLFNLATIPHDLQTTSPNSSSQPATCYFNITLVFLVPHRTNLTFSFILQFKIMLPNTDQAHDKISVNHYE
jgi:hypothetical protein